MTWRDALRAMAIDAARRSEGSRPMASGPSDEVTVAEKRGAAYAFNVMAEELNALSGGSYDSREALRRLRRLLDDGAKR